MGQTECNYSGGGTMGRVKDGELFLLIKNFLTVYLPVQRKASPHTVADYRITLDQFLTFITKKKNISYLSVTFNMINKEMVEGYLDYLTMNKKLAPATRNNRLAALKSFLSYASACRPEYISIMNEVSSIRMQKDDPFSKVDYMSEEAVSALLNTPDTTTKIGIRDQFFMILLYDTGARIQEIIDIRISHIKLGKTPSVLLHGKGNKTRIVPLMQSTVAHLKNYMGVFHPGATWMSQNYLFYTERKNMKTQICDDTIRVRLNKYASIARSTCNDVPEKVHPHLWRHTRAMHLYQHGMDLTLISQWLGHRQFTTTLVYAHADTEAKRKAIEKAMGEENIYPDEIATFELNNEEKLKKLYGLK